jgi:hypothetical protein
MSGSGSTYVAVFGGSPSVLERLLLAIINAHTTQETEGRHGERLEAAMAALIGPTMPSDRDLERALLHMARKRREESCDLEMAALQFCGGVQPRAARSVLELATVAVREMLGITAADKAQATVRVLYEMFRKRRTAMEHDPVREAREAEAVQRLCDELAEWDVPTRL